MSSAPATSRLVARLDASSGLLADGSGPAGSVLGGKGAALARLITEGYRVPRTGVVTTNAYRRVVALDSSTLPAAATEARVDEVFASITIAPEVSAAIAELAAWVGGGGPVAIRSSATVEDLHGSSFAGQYRSFLNVDSSDPDAVVAAVRSVWASLWYPAPQAYRSAFGFDDDDVAMAVVIMAMIPATSAGVVFTSDPAGAADSCRVEAVEGLGESLVSGQRTPSAWVVPRSGSTELPGPVRRAVDVAVDIADRFDAPQDVEWAAVDDDVYVVQSRPITVLESDDGFDSPIDDHELTTAGIAEMVPGVLPPLLWEVNHYLLGEAFRSFLDNLGILRGTATEDAPFVRRVRGRAVIDFDQLRLAASDVPGAVAQLERDYFGRPDEDPDDVPEPAPRGWWGRLRALRGSIARDLRTAQTRAQVTEQATVVTQAAELLQLNPVGVSDLSDGALLAYTQRLVDLAARGMAAELGVAAAGGSAYQRALNMLEKHLGAEKAARELQVLLTGAAAGVVRPRSGSAAVFAGPSWEELGTTPPQLDDAATADQRALEQRKQVESELRSLPGWRLHRLVRGQFIDIRIHLLRRDLREARGQTRRREAVKAAVLTIGGAVRVAHLEAGRRLIQRGSLDAAEDVELLTSAEFASALCGEPFHRSDVLRRRRNWLRRYAAEGALPQRFVGVPSRVPAPLPEGDVLTGWASSPGRYRGVARTVVTADGSLEPGEVLVAASTDASWSPLFLKAGAVVVERGGPLSHAAILSRELGVPAVLNVAEATRVLDGCVITVDGDDGSVVIESPAPAAPTSARAER